MKRFMMALLLISAQATFAADQGGQAPRPFAPGCLMQLVGGMQALTDAALENPTIAAALAAARAVTAEVVEAAGDASAAERGEAGDDDADQDDASATPAVDALATDAESADGSAALLKRLAALEAELAAIKAAAQTNEDVRAALNQTA